MKRDFIMTKINDCTKIYCAKMKEDTLSWLRVKHNFASIPKVFFWLK